MKLIWQKQWPGPGAEGWLLGGHSMDVLFQRDSQEQWGRLAVRPCGAGDLLGQVGVVLPRWLLWLLEGWRVRALPGGGGVSCG